MATARGLRFAALDAGAAPLERLRSDNAAALQRALVTVGGTACTLVLPHRLTTLLTHVFPSGLGVLPNVAECVALTDELATVHSSTVVYLTQPQVEDVRAIATHAGLLRSVQPVERRFVVLVAGPWTAMCTEVLAHQQLGDAFHIEHVEMGFVALDNDLVTLGRERCLYDCYVQGNKSVLEDTAAALQQLQRLYGCFQHIKYKGELSAFVFQRLMEKQNEERTEAVATREEGGGEGKTNDDGAASPRTKKKKKKTPRALHTLVLLDRSIDFASVLCSPLTLEALVGELFDSRDGFATLPAPLSGGDEPSSSDQLLTADMVALNASEPLYQCVRNLHIQAVTPTLSAEALTVKTKFDRFRETSAAASTAEVHEFVKTVPQMKAKQESLERLVALTESIEAVTTSRAFCDQWQLERSIMDVDPDTDIELLFDEIEEMVFKHAPLLTVLRLVCLFSVANDGIPQLALAKLKMRLLQTYGHELLFSLENLERLELLLEAPSPPSLVEATTNETLWAPPKSVFAKVAADLGAIDVSVDALVPGSMAFVTSGYAPLTCRLVEELLNNRNWGALEASLNELRGPRAEIRMKTRKLKAKAERAGDSGEVTDDRIRAASSTSEAKPQVMVVCFVGGVTYIEIAALRWLAQFYPSYEILIAGTSIMNGQTFLHELTERIPSTT